ncbi:MAG: DUF4375 domain-containing protein [Phycisphaerales bacterium]|nr:DUF4375 domain-containing protein [Phycisphaerales bacterium]
MQFEVVFVLTILAVAVIVVVVWLRRGRKSAVMPYREARRTIIDSMTGFAVPRSAPPARPVGLDKRLPADKLREFQALWPPTKDNWGTYFDAFYLVIESIRDELALIDPEQDWYELLSDARRFVLVAYGLESEVNNGGFDQFFLNCAGDGAYAAPGALRALGAMAAASLAERANTQFPAGPPRDRTQRLAQMDNLPAAAGEAWSALDSEFYALDIPFGGIAAHLGGRFILDNPNEFYQPD